MLTSARLTNDAHFQKIPSLVAQPSKKNRVYASRTGVLINTTFSNRQEYKNFIQTVPITFDNTLAAADRIILVKIADVPEHHILQRAASPFYVVPTANDPASVIALLFNYISSVPDRSGNNADIYQFAGLFQHSSCALSLFHLLTINDVIAATT